MNTHTPEIECRFGEENSRAELAITNGRIQEAAQLLIDIIDKDPDNWRAYNNLGILSWSTSKWIDAYQLFKKAVSLKGDFEDALVNLFDAALKLRKINEVSTLFNAAIEINPSLNDVRVIYETIIGMKDEIYQSKRALSIGFYSPVLGEAEKLLEEGNYYAAANKFLESVDTDGPNGPAYCGLGIISYYKQKFHDAYSLFIESIRLSPCDPETYLNLLDVAKEIGKTDVAKEIFNVYKKEFPELENVAQHFN
jgi:tetratricopeptide (TPR) repeat protein